MNVPDFSQGATNVYRTNGFIVRQDVEIRSDCEHGILIVSHDTFYRRTPKRDAEYELKYFGRLHLNGRRFPTTMYSRKYVD